MKILHLLSSSSFSGAENVVCQIIGMMKDETDVEMLYCSPDGLIREALHERNVAFIPLRSLTVKEVKRVIKEQKPDIIHAHDMRASFIAALSCGKLKLISHIHNNAFNSRGISLKSIAYWFAAKKSKHIFWVSQSAYNGYVFHNAFESKSSVLYNIIDVNALYDKMNLDANTYDYDVVYLGRISYEKNPQRLMKICQLLTEKKPDVKIAVIGTGNLEDEVKRLSEEYKINSNVHFLGFLSNPLKILHDSKVMIMTSLWEGTPMCALEAMALGVPIISTPVDGLKDLIINDKNGYLSDDNEELSNKIVEIVCNDSLHAKYSTFIREQAVKINDIEQYKKHIICSYNEA